MSDLADPMTPQAQVAADAHGSSIAVQGVSTADPDLGIVRTLWVGLLNFTITILALPSLLGAALLLVVLNPRYNPGPLVFRQERVGRGGKVFTIYKFRTMSVAPVDSTLCIEANAGRITKLGRVLRKFRVDELPNFVNVALGDMNVIGPRPDAKAHAETYVRTVYGYSERFEVKPGITGFAQVVQGYAACEDSTRKKARYDRFYVRHRSARLDLFVVIQTLRVMLTGFGSR